MMIDRQFFGDLVLAVALVLPTAALAKTQAASPHAGSKATATSSVIARAALADRTMTERGVSLLG